MKSFLSALFIFIIAALALTIYKGFVAHAPFGQHTATTTPATIATTTTETYENKYPDLIQIDVPVGGAGITSPITVTGKARGTWYFEASFPVTLVNWDGLIIAEGHADAQGDWMTDEFVPFTATLTFTKPECGTDQDFCMRGSIIFKNDNPSGDPARDKAVEVPVRFK